MLPISQGCMMTDTPAAQQPNKRSEFQRCEFFQGASNGYSTASAAGCTAQCGTWQSKSARLLLEKTCQEHC